MNIKQKITAGMATAAMIGGIMAPVAHGATIQGNGPFSNNVVATFKVNSKTINQGSSTTAVNSINTKNNTGKNNANFNVGGTNAIMTGNAKSTVNVKTTGGSNMATVAGCGCPTPDMTSIKGNGAFSTNVVLGGSMDVFSVNQGTSTTSVTSVTSNNNTGGNSSSFNVGSGSVAVTGNAVSTTTVETTGGSNVLVATP